MLVFLNYFRECLTYYIKSLLTVTLQIPPYFDLHHLYNFKRYWLSVKQVIYKKIRHAFLSCVYGSTVCLIFFQVLLSSVFSSNPAKRTRQLLNKTIPTREETELQISIQLGGTPTTSNRRRFFSLNQTRRRHPQSSGSLSTQD